VAGWEGERTGAPGKREVVRREITYVLVLERKRLAVGEIQDGIGSHLSHGRLHACEVRDAVAFEPHDVMQARAVERCNCVAVAANSNDEGVASGIADKEIAAGRAGENVCRRTAGDEIIPRVRGPRVRGVCLRSGTQRAVAGLRNGADTSCELCCRYSVDLVVDHLGGHIGGAVDHADRIPDAEIDDRVVLDEKR